MNFRWKFGSFLLKNIGGGGLLQEYYLSLLRVPLLRLVLIFSLVYFIIFMDPILQNFFGVNLDVF
jgi:hypothetical protein